MRSPATPTTEPFCPTCEADIDAASRDQLVEYLQRWCIQCYDHELTSDLREAATDNFRTEGC